MGKGSGDSCRPAMMLAAPSGAGEVTPAQFAAAYDFQFTGGLHAMVDVCEKMDSWRFGPSIRVEGRILNARRQEVGSFTRSLSGPAHDLTVRHGTISLDPRLQGRGFGTAFERFCCDRYRELGVRRVRLTADNHGGYVWAVRGYELELPDVSDKMSDLERHGFKTPGELLDWAYADTLHRLWRSADGWQDQLPAAAVPERQLRRFVAGFPTADQLAARSWGRLHGGVRDIARAGGSWTWRDMDGRKMWLGKLLLMHASWNGVKRLDG